MGFRILFFIFCAILYSSDARSQSCDSCLQVKNYQKISDTQGNFNGVLDNSDLFGRAIAAIGDVDGDGTTDLVSGAVFDDDGGFERGAVWILFLNPNGTVKAEQKISSTQGGFIGALGPDDRFGVAVAPMGDVDGDNIPDIAVGAYRDDDGGSERGAVYIIFLNTDGTVKGYQKISSTQGNFVSSLGNTDWFGSAISCLGDVNKDGINDIAVSAHYDDDGGSNRGAVYILFLDTNGTVKSNQKISDTQGNFTGVFDNGDNFGGSLTGLDDLNGDSIPDIAVGVWGDDDGGLDRGAVWILFLDTNGTVKSSQKISSTQGNFSGILDDGDLFGMSATSISRLNGDDIQDLAVGAGLDDDGGSGKGAVWLLYLTDSGTVCAYNKISDTEGNFTGGLDNGDAFGTSLGPMGDFDGNGVVDLLVGVQSDDDGGSNRGAVWILFLEDTCKCIVTADFSSNRVCVGTATSFTDLSFDSTYNVTSWEWSFGDGDSLTGVANPNHFFSSSGAYNTTLIAGNDAVPPCYDTITFVTLVDSTINSSDSFYVCSGDSIYLGGLWQSSGGTYMDTLVSISGCDSIVASTVTINSIIQTPLTQTICSNDSVLLEGAFQNTLGVYFDTLTSVYGCDSVLATTLTVNPTITTSLSQNICVSDSIFLAGAWQNTAGIYRDTLATVNLCDSIIVTTLVMDSSYLLSDPTAFVCTGDSILIYGVFKSGAGVYLDSLTTGNGCDSVRSTTLNLSPTFNTPVTQSICNTDSIFLEGSWQYTAGVYTDTLLTVLGCDSVIITTLIVVPSSGASVAQSICSGDSMFLSGTWQSSGGNYTDTLTSIIGCDSLIITTLTIDPTYSTAITQSLCANDSVFLGGAWQNTVGVYSDTLISAAGCDSFILTTLVVYPVIAISVGQNICPNDSIYLEGSWQSTAGVYVDSLTDINLCDSIVATTLVIDSTYIIADLAFSICAGDSMLIYSNYQSVVGTYFDSLTTVTGCDSIHFTELSINPVYTTSIAQTICDNDSLFLGGAWQDTSGVYQDTVVAVNGCDSVLVSTLTVNATYITTNSQAICASDSIFLGGAWQNSVGTYTDSLVSVAGCDSILITGLTIESNYITSQVSIICEGDSSYLSGGWQNTAGVYTDTLGSIFGCDSIISTTLSIYSGVTAGSGEDTTIILGGSANLGGSGGLNYSWNPVTGLSCTNCQYPLATPLVTTTYYLTVIDSNGCMGSDMVVVYVDASGEIFVPNLFSPNGDGINDLFHIDGKGIEEVKLLIYDRWGEEVFLSTSIEVGWDGYFRGEMVNSGVFVYVVRGTYVNGETFEKNGTLTLIR